MESFLGVEEGEELETVDEMEPLGHGDVVEVVVLELGDEFFIVVDFDALVLELLV